jgi:hypothetical protein
MALVCLMATFCLIPPIDTATRKGLFDATLFGCVPVLCYKEPQALSTFAVLLFAADVLRVAGSVMQSLRAVPAGAVAAKRTVLRVWHTAATTCSRGCSSQWQVRPNSSFWARRF